MVTDSAGSWVLLAYRVPREPSAPRIAVWRRLRKLGAAQLGDGLVALPGDARTQEQLEWVADQIGEAGGSSMLWRADLMSRVQERALITELAAARAGEYEALIGRVRSVAATDGAEAGRVLRSVRRELRAIERRDYFPPDQRDRARREVTAFADRFLGTAPTDDRVDAVNASVHPGAEPR